jgi:hypothetical protein
MMYLGRSISKRKLKAKVNEQIKGMITGEFKRVMCIVLLLAEVLVCVRFGGVVYLIICSTVVEET